MIRRTLVTAALAVGLVVSGGAAASAHECYVVKRSAQGDAGAAHSANWYTLEVAELYSHAHYFVPGVDDALTEAEIAEAVALTEAAGVPTSFTVFDRFTIPRSVEDAEHLSSHASDGKGIDHFFVRYGDTLAGIAVTVSAG